MRYSRLELSIIAIGTAAILASMLFTYRAAPVTEEIIAQLLMIGVLIAAVHWGRNGGFVGATLASLVYIFLRIPLVAEHGGLTEDITWLIGTRVMAYGLIGIVGGELSRRVKYLVARAEGAHSVDEWSQVYNQEHIGTVLDAAIGQHERYGMPLTVILLEVSERVTDALKPSRHRVLVRGVANLLRNDTRLVDEVARLDDGRFLVLLPHTPRDKAEAVAERLRGGVADTIGSRLESVPTTIIGTPDDTAALGELRDSLLDRTET